MTKNSWLSYECDVFPRKYIGMDKLILQFACLMWNHHMGLKCLHCCIMLWILHKNIVSLIYKISTNEKNLSFLDNYILPTEHKTEQGNLHDTHKSKIWPKNKYPTLKTGFWQNRWNLCKRTLHVGSAMVKRKSQILKTYFKRYPKIFGSPLSILISQKILANLSLLVLYWY